MEQHHHKLVITPAHYHAAEETAATEAEWENTTSVYLPTEDAQCWLISMGWRWEEETGTWRKELMGTWQVARGTSAAMQVELLAQAA